MLILVGGRDLDTDPRLALGHDGKAEADREDTAFEQPVAHADRRRGLAHDDGADRRALQ